MEKRIPFPFPNSVIAYQGPSRIDGSPIVAIITGLHADSKNEKTGPMAQMWIIRADMDPVAAKATKADYAICADCKFTGHQTGISLCYVSMKAPLAVFHAFERGAYPTMDPSDIADYLKAHDIAIRFGAYGEPTALPVWVLNELAEGTRHTGYTHQFDAPNVARLYRHVLMASVDSDSEAERAAALGFRYFRTRLADAPLLPGEIMCPASDEMNHRTTCDACTLCDGSRGPNDRRRNIAIVIHGANKVHALKVLKVAR